MERMLFPKRIQKKIKATKEEDEICHLFFFFSSFVPVVEPRMEHGQAMALVCVK